MECFNRDFAKWIDMFLPLNEIYQGDARTLLKQVEPNSIALALWSPPYHVGKAYEEGIAYDEWVEMLREVIALHFPILKPGGFLTVNIADILCFPDPEMPKIQAANPRRHKSAVTREDVLKAKAEHPDYNRYQLAELLDCSEQTIDRRLNGNNIRGGKYAMQTRVKLVSGIIEQHGMAAGLYLYDRRVWVKDAAWENSKWHTLSYRAVDEFEYIYTFWKPGITTVNRERLTPDEWRDWGSRGVWEFPSVRANNDHEAKFPLELPRRLIRLLSDKGETVLDCFMGSGTTAVAAIQADRNFIGIELLEKYAQLGRRSAQKALEQKKVRQLTMPLTLKERKRRYKVG